MKSSLSKLKPCRKAALPLALAAMLVAGCSTSPNGRTQMVAPAPVSEVYSEVDMQLSLATAGKLPKKCTTDLCTDRQAFDHQVQQVGHQLSIAADELFPENAQRIGHFSFEVADTDKVGTASNAKGKIVVMRGVQQMHLEDSALAFLMAREMGRVIGRHHDENSGTRLLVSVLAGVLFPVSGIFSAGSAAQATTTSTLVSSSTIASTAASTATSLLGSKIALDSIRPKQMSEADFIAAGLLKQSGWNLQQVYAAFGMSPQPEGDDAWIKDFHTSLARIEGWSQQIAQEQALAEAAQVEQEAREIAQAEAAENAPPAVVADIRPADTDASATAMAATESASQLPEAMPVLLAHAEHIDTVQQTEMPATRQQAAEHAAKPLFSADDYVFPPPPIVVAQHEAPAVAAKQSSAKTAPPSRKAMRSPGKNGKANLASVRDSRRASAKSSAAAKLVSVKSRPGDKRQVASSDTRAAKSSSSFISRLTPKAKLNKSVKVAAGHPSPKL